MSDARKPYPSDVSDAEWEFLGPYLTLMWESAPQRAHALRDGFDAVRYVVKTGCPWDMLPHDLTPRAAVYQQARRRVAAGAFEAVAHDLRVILRLADEREARPTAVVLDSRTVQSTPESGGRSGYDGAKRRKGSKAHITLDTLGHLLALKVTAASDQDRAQVADLAARVQEVTGGMVEVAFVDRGTPATRPPSRPGRAGSSRRSSGCRRRRRGSRSSPAVGGGAVARLARPVPPAGPRLRAAGRDAGRLALARVPHRTAIEARAPKCITGSTRSGGRPGSTRRASRRTASWPPSSSAGGRKP